MFLIRNTNMKLSLLFFIGRFSGFGKQKHLFGQNSGTSVSWHKAQMCMFLQMKCSKNYMYLSTKISNEKEYQTLSWFVSFNCWELVSCFQGYYLFLQQKLQACCHLLLSELRQTRSVLASCSSPPLHRSFPGHRPFAQIYSNYKPCPFACNHGVAIFKG